MTACPQHPAPFDLHHVDADASRPWTYLAVTVELPAGLIDAGETAAEAAVRELKEETGYTAVVQ